MTKARVPQRQLELPVLGNVNVKSPATDSTAPTVLGACVVSSRFHKLASADDQSIYRSISDGYFRTSVKGT